MTININELRQLAQAASPGPDGVSLNRVKLLQDFQKEATPAAVSELLDRLEAAESDALEQARLNGMGSEREAALMAKLEAAEKELESWKGLAQQFGNELDTVRAKIAEMERQKPSIRPAALYPVISWLRNGCDPMKAADELEMLAAATEAKP